MPEENESYTHTVAVLDKTLDFDSILQTLTADLCVTVCVRGEGSHKQGLVGVYI